MHSVWEGGRNWDCIHDHINQPRIKSAPQNYVNVIMGEDMGRRQVEEKWRPIRIAIYSTMSDVLSAEQSDYIIQLLQDSSDWFKSSLKVRPIDGNLHVPRRCGKWSVSDSEIEQCLEAEPVSCGTMRSIPASHLTGLKLNKTYDSGLSWTYEELPEGVGIPDADLIIYATAGTSNVSGLDRKHGGGCSAGSNTLAYSGTCFRDQYDRPVAGYIHFCSDKVQPSTDESLVAQDRAAAAHEITHILGFSRSSFPLFRKPDSTPYMPRCPHAPGCTSEHVLGSLPDAIHGIPYVVNTTIDENGGKISRIITPMVVEVARLHYGCQSITGADLENFEASQPQEGTHTAGSHWEKRTMMTEYMTGSSSGPFKAVYSAFTLALLRDSGWYQVDWSRAEELKWGKEWGCAFEKEQCLTHKLKVNSSKRELSFAVPHFCSSNGADGHTCTFDRSAIGFCPLVEYKYPLPVQYQYFTNPDVGGLDELMDYCPVILPYENRLCDNSHGKSHIFACGNRDCQGSTYGAGSACFSTSLVLQNYELAHFPAVSAGCYKHECRNGHLLIFTPIGGVLNCSKEASTGVPGYTGQLFCPPKSEDFCFNQTAFMEKVETMAQPPEDIFLMQNPKNSSHSTSSLINMSATFLIMFVGILLRMR